MFKYRSVFISVMLIFLTFQSNLSAQTFGFGCLGFVGGYGGYSYQKYHPGTLNDYINNYNISYSDSITTPFAKFGQADGYRLGLNFFRAKYKGFIITAKGFYQDLSEKHEAKEHFSNGDGNTSLELEIRNWALGIDLGTEITGALSWKIVDAASGVIETGETVIADLRECQAWPTGRMAEAYVASDPDGAAG